MTDKQSEEVYRGIHYKGVRVAQGAAKFIYRMAAIRSKDQDNDPEGDNG